MPRNIKRYTSNSTDNKTKQLLFNEQAQSSSYMEKNKQREATKPTRPRRTLQSSRRAKGTQTPQTSQILPFPSCPLSALPRSSGRASCTELGPVRDAGGRGCPYPAAGACSPTRRSPSSAWLSSRQHTAPASAERAAAARFYSLSSGSDKQTVQLYYLTPVCLVFYSEH